MGVEEGAQEGVEVVGGGGEVEPGWGEGLVDVGVEGWHAGYRGGIVDEGAAEDAEGEGGHGYFYRVVDVGDYCPAFGGSEVSEHWAVGGNIGDGGGDSGARAVCMVGEGGDELLAHCASSAWT